MRTYKRINEDYLDNGIRVSDDGLLSQNGQPIVFYHSFYDDDEDADMIWLSTNEDYSREFGDTTVKCYLRVERPYIDEVLRDSQGNEIIFDGEPASIGYLDSIPESDLLFLIDNYDCIMDPTGYITVVFDRDAMVDVEEC